MSKEIPQIVLGSFIAAFVINAVVIPNQFLAGGISGLSLLLHYLTNLPVGLLVLALNIPLFIWAKRYFPWAFVFRSLLGMLSFSLALQLTRGLLTFQSQDLFLVALLAGVGTGVGYGIVFANRANVGGIDIVSTALCRKFSLGVGTINFAFNLIIISASLFFFPLKLVAYTLLSMYITSLIVDRMQTGLNVSKTVFIISSEEQVLAPAIIKGLRRGVTLLEGQGGFTHQDKQVILTTVSLLQLAKLKEIIQEIDPKAFVIVTGTSEVLGRGFKTIHDEVFDLA